MVTQAQIRAMIRSELRSIESRMRSMILLGQIGSINDNTSQQSGQVSTLDGSTRDQVEYPGEYGLASNPPSGSECYALSCGGDADNVVLIAVSDPATRIKGLKTGEAALYNGPAATMILMREDGSILVKPKAGQKVTVANDEGAVTIAAVATVGSTVSLSEAFATWVSAVTGAAGVPPLVGDTIGSVATGSPTLETDGAP